MADDEKPVNLELVKRADQRLDAVRSRIEENGQAARDVPLDEIVADESLTYSLKRAAELVGMSTQTLRRAIKDGELKAFGGGRGGAAYRISRVELAKWWRSQGGGDLFHDGRSNE